MIPINEHHKIWLAVLDGAQAQFYDVSLAPLKIKPHPDGHFDGNKQKSHEMGSDSPSRSFESASTARHAAAPHVDPHEHAEELFVTGIAHRLSQAGSEKRYDRLIIVAPPRAMAVFRKKIGKDAKALIEREITQDWVKIPPIDIEKHLAKQLSPS